MLFVWLRMVVCIYMQVILITVELYVPIATMHVKFILVTLRMCVLTPLYIFAVVKYTYM